MLRGVGLEQGAARPVTAPRPSGGLGQQLIGPLGGPQVAAGFILQGTLDRIGHMRRT